MFDNQIFIGVTSSNKNLFQEEFPNLKQIQLPSYNISYSNLLPISLKLLSDWPKINSVIREENSCLQAIIEENKIDTIISDNRFGLRGKTTKNIFISHQLFLKTPVLLFLAQEINKRFILNFDEVWVPDYEDENLNLSGDLSHGKMFHQNLKYIGPLSRLNKAQSTPIEYDYLVLLSGPEPQHSLLGEKLLQFANRTSSKKFAFASHLFKVLSHQNVDGYFQSNNHTISQLIQKSKTIICRSGYSTLMDMHHLEKKNLILIPTKGQTEQEYLADYWQEKFKTKLVQEQQINKSLFD